MSEGRSVLLTRRKNYRCIVTTTDARQQLAGWASAFVPQLAATSTTSCRNSWGSPYVQSQCKKRFEIRNQIDSLHLHTVAYLNPSGYCSLSREDEKEINERCFQNCCDRSGLWSLVNTRRLQADEITINVKADQVIGRFAPSHRGVPRRRQPRNLRRHLQPNDFWREAFRSRRLPFDGRF